MVSIFTSILLYPKAHPAQSIRYRGYVNRPSTRHLLGVDKFVGNWSLASWALSSAFDRSLDAYRSSAYYVANLLERDIKVLIYVGKARVPPVQISLFANPDRTHQELMI
jgi:hypothetical protein